MSCRRAAVKDRQAGSTPLTARLTQRCLCFNCSELRPKPRLTHLTRDKTDPGGRVTGPESHSLGERAEPFCSWAAAPSAPPPTSLLIAVLQTHTLGHTHVTTLAVRSLTLGALTCPCLVQFRCHFCKKAFFDRRVPEAPSPVVTCHRPWLFFILDLSTIGCDLFAL